MPSDDYAQRKAQADQISGGIDIRRLDSGLEDAAREVGRRMAARKLKELGPKPVELDQVVDAPWRDARGRACHYDPRIPKNMAVMSNAISGAGGITVLTIRADGTEEWSCDDSLKEALQEEFAERKMTLYATCAMNLIVQTLKQIATHALALREHEWLKREERQEIAEKMVELEQREMVQRAEFAIDFPEFVGRLPEVVQSPKTSMWGGTKEITATSFDPLGRTIICKDAGQARREAERHGLTIMAGPGA